MCRRLSLERLHSSTLRHTHEAIFSTRCGELILAPFQFQFSFLTSLLEPCLSLPSQSPTPSSFPIVSFSLSVYAPLHSKKYFPSRLVQYYAEKSYNLDTESCFLGSHLSYFHEKYNPLPQHEACFATCAHRCATMRDLVRSHLIR